MSDETTSGSNQQTIVIALVVIAVLLAAIVGVLIYQQTKTTVPAPTASVSNTSNTANQGSTQGSTQGNMGDSSATEFDPKTATKVPSGTTPEQWVKAYYDACDKGDFETAFKHLPAAKQTGSSASALKEQLEGYGITGYTMGTVSAQGDTTTVTVDQVTKSYGTFVNEWTFVKVNGNWLVKGKAVTGMK